MLLSHTHSPAAAGWPLLFALLAADGLAVLGQLAGSLGTWLGLLPVTPYLLRLEEPDSLARLAIGAKWLAAAPFLALAWRTARQPRCGFAWHCTSRCCSSTASSSTSAWARASPGSSSCRAWMACAATIRAWCSPPEARGARR